MRLLASVTTLILLLVLSACDADDVTASHEVVKGTAKPATPAHADGFPKARLARIEAVLQKEVDDGVRAGFVAMVAKDGEVAYAVAVGMADRERNTAMTKETRFRIASMTKPVTTVGLMRLVEDGAVLLTDPVSKYIPAFAQMRVATSTAADAEGAFETEPLERPITIHHLLTHTSGIGYVFDTGSDLGRRYLEHGPDSAGDLAVRVSELSTLPLYDQPGEKWRYSWSTDIAGRVIEVVSGKSLEDFMRGRIFEPLGMSNTEFFLDHSDFGGVATVYDVDKSGALIRADVDNSKLFDASGHALNETAFGWMSGGAGLISTVPDYMRFCLMILNEGELDGARILSPASVRLMLQRNVSKETFVLDNYNTDGLAFGLGGYVVEEPGLRGELAARGQWGWSGYYGTAFFVSPQDEVAVVVMTNKCHRTRRPPALSDSSRPSPMARPAISHLRASVSSIICNCSVR